MGCMRYGLLPLAFLLIGSSAHAVPVGPSPEMDLGLAGFVMLVSAAYLASRWRH